MKISLIIPSLNREVLLYNTLNKFLDEESIDFEIIVVDQSKTKNLQIVDLAEKKIGKIKYYNIEKRGLPHARNFGISKANGDFVIFCDDDVIPHPGFITNHIKNYKDLKVAGVGGRVVLKNERDVRLSKRIGIFREFDCVFIDNFNGIKKRYIDHAQGCNMSFRKNLLIKVGGFDERFGGSAHLEETDLCIRLKRLGYKMVFEPKAELLHLKDSAGGCRAENYYQWFYWFSHNYMLFFLKNCKLTFLPTFLVTRIMRLLLAAIKRSNFLIFIWGVQGTVDGVFTYWKKRKNRILQ